MIDTPQLETHVSHACNLACEGCGHFSDQKHRGNVSVESFVEQCRPWSSRLRPRMFELLGGEPTLNPQLPQIVRAARDLWPSSEINLITNGWFLHRHPELPRALTETGAVLDISVHHPGPEYQAKIAEVRTLVASWNVRAVFRESYKWWTRLYTGKGADIKPFADGNSEASWKACLAKWCLTLHEGKLYKCPQLAYLPMQHQKYQLGPEWEPYLAYQPLTAPCSDAELEQFVQRRAEGVCGMCPAKPERFAIPSPIRSKTLPMIRT